MPAVVFLRPLHHLLRCSAQSQPCSLPSHSSRHHLISHRCLTPQSFVPSHPGHALLQLAKFLTCRRPRVPQSSLVGLPRNQGTTQSFLAFRQPLTCPQKAQTVDFRVVEKARARSEPCTNCHEAFGDVSLCPRPCKRPEEHEPSRLVRWQKHARALLTHVFFHQAQVFP